MARLTVLLADDNVIVRAGVRALLAADPDIEVVGEAGDLGSTIALGDTLAPRVLVTDIRMPPEFADEGILAAREVRRRHPGTGVVVLSQYDDPAYAVDLLSEGAAGYGYLLKAGVADQQRLCRAVHEVAAGGSVLDPEVVAHLLAPVSGPGLSAQAEALLDQVAAGRSVKAIAASTGATPEQVDANIQELFSTLARDATAGSAEAVRRLRSLHSAITRREEQGQTLSRLLPSGLALRIGEDPSVLERSEDLVVSVLMSDVRGYTGIAEVTRPAVLAGQLGEHRTAMNRAILDLGGTVMQYVGDSVMAVFGAPEPMIDHAQRAVRAAAAMHEAQRALDEAWRERELAPFGLGIGISTGDVTAAALGSAERLEYTLVGDTVNLAQRLQDLARPAGSTVISGATFDALVASTAPGAAAWRELGPQGVKGRQRPVRAYHHQGARDDRLDVA